MDVFVIGLMACIFYTPLVFMVINYYQIMQFREFKKFRYQLGVGWFRAIYTNRREISGFDPELQRLLLKGRLIAKCLYLSLPVIMLIAFLYSEFCK